MRRTIAIATAIMVGSVFLSRIMGLVREQVIAVYGGTSFEIDAYVTAFFIPELLNHLLAGGFLSVTFIPLFQKYIVGQDEEGASRCFSNLITVGSVLFAVLIPISIWFTPEILGLMGSHIADPGRRDITVRLTRIILPAQILFYWGGFLSAVQMAHKKFFFPALAPLLYNLGIILGGVLLGPFIRVEGFAWGVLAGALAGNFLLQVPGALRTGLKYRPRFDLTDPDLLLYVKLTIPLILGLGLTFSNEVFFRFFGSYLGEGGTSSINYALRTMMMVVAVFGQASGVAFFPFLSAMAVEHRFGEMTTLLNSVLSRIALYLLPLCGFMIVLSPQIIALLFQHGNFSAASTAATAPVLSVYLIGAFSFSAVMIISRSFYAVQNTFLPMVISTICALLSIPLYQVFSRQMGASGIALAAVLGMTLQFVTLYLVWFRRYEESRSSLQFLRTLAVSLIIAAVGAGCCWAIKAFLIGIGLPFGPVVNSATVIAASSVPSLVLVFCLYEAAGLQNVRDSVRGLLKRQAS